PRKTTLFCRRSAMLRPIASALAIVLCAGSILAARTPSETAPPFTPPEAYGSDTQVLVLGAAAFVPQGSMIPEYGGGGYIARIAGDPWMWAPVNLPNGAVVEHVCAQVYDTNVFGDLSLEWGVYELGSAQENPMLVNISSATDDYSAGYHIFCVPDVP